MKLLTKNDIKKFVHRSNEKGWRPTTYDATVGEIITRKGVCTKSQFRLEPRRIAWVMSKERFEIPNNVTGITTLRTTWTRQGILTLTVGVVDPGYDGYLSTAVINFGKNEFMIRKGDTFFRTVFFEHEETEGTGRKEWKCDYRESVIADTRSFSDSFLFIDSLAAELAPKIFGTPRVIATIGMVAVAVALVAFVMPPAFRFGEQVIAKNANIEIILDRLEYLEQRERERR